MALVIVRLIFPGSGRFVTHVLLMESGVFTLSNIRTFAYAPHTALIVG
jgi:hypothetical protein